MAKLKATYDKAEDIPTEYKDLFQQKGEKWAIDLDGNPTDANVARLEHAIKKERDENQKLREDAKLHPKTPDEVQALIEELEAAKVQLESGGGKPDQEQINKLVEAQLRTKVGPLERKLAQVTKERDEEKGQTGKLTSQITMGKIELAIRAAAEKAKVVPSAIPDVVMRGQMNFELIEVDGKTKVVTKDGLGITPGLEPDGYISEIAPVYPHYWPGNQGAGANGSGSSFGITEKNPWLKVNWNMTEQGQILKQYGPDKTGQLAKAAGSFVGATSPPEK